MLRFLATLLGRSARRSDSTPPRTRRPARIGVEELTPRVLMNAGPIGLGGGLLGHGPFHAGAIDPGAGGTAGAPGAPGATGGARAAHHASLVANLSDSSGATGQALFTASNGTLSVRVHGAAANATLPVTVNGTSVGSLTTNASGNGHAVFKNVTASAGQSVMVGDLTGAFTQARLSATLTGTATGVSGKAHYGAIRGTLDVSIKGATANTTYNISIGGTVVGSFTTNSQGRAHLDVTMPSAAVNSGATISIADTAGNPAILQGTFA